MCVRGGAASVTKATARRSTRPTTMSRLGPDPKSQSDQSTEEVGFRQRYFGEEYCYVMDAKSKGNIGRYLNVSHV